MIKKFFTIFLLSQATMSYSLTLDEALKAAYHNDENFKIAQENYKEEIQVFSKAVANFMPHGELSFTNQDGKADGQDQTQSRKRAISIKQPIFNGGTDLAGLKAANEAARVAKAKYYSKEQEYFYNAIKAYMEVIEQRETVEVLTKTSEANEKFLKYAEERLKVGEATRTEVAKATANLESIKAQLAQAKAAYNGAISNFKEKYKVDPIDAKFPDKIHEIASDSDSFHKIVMANNLNLQIAKSQSKYGSANAYSSFKGIMPSISASLQKETDFTHKDKNLANRLQHTPKKSSAAVVELKIPLLGSGGAEYAQIREAQSKSRASALQLDAAMRMMHSQTISAWEQYLAMKSATISQQSQVQAQQMTLDGVMKEEEVGNKSLLEVLKEENDLLKAKLDLIRSKRNLIQLHYQLRELAGMLTTKAMKYQGKDIFNPEKEYKKNKFKIVGF